MISGIFSRINENWQNRLFAIVICWFVFGFCYMAVQGYKRSFVSKELKNFNIPNSCYLIFPNNDHSIIVVEKGINQAGIKNMEKQFLNKGYERVSVNKFASSDFVVIKECEDGDTFLVVKWR